MNIDNKKQVGERIKIIRTSLGLTMKEFGRKFNPHASDSIVSRWENGKSLPNNERLKRISEIGNVSMSYLLEGKYMVNDIHVLPEEEQMYMKQEFKNKFEKFNNALAESISKSIQSIDLNNIPLANLLVLNSALKLIENYQTLDDDGNSLTLFNGLFTQLNKSFLLYNDTSVPNSEKKKKLKHLEDDLVKNFPISLQEIFEYFNDNIK